MSRCTECMGGQGRDCKCRKPLSDRTWMWLILTAWAWFWVAVVAAGWAIAKAAGWIS